jgi:hypothetical protein
MESAGLLWRLLGRLMPNWVGLPMFALSSRRCASARRPLTVGRKRECLRTESVECTQKAVGRRSNRGAITLHLMRWVRSHVHRDVNAECACPHQAEIVGPRILRRPEVSNMPARIPQRLLRVFRGLVALRRWALVVSLVGLDLEL